MMSGSSTNPSAPAAQNQPAAQCSRAVEVQQRVLSRLQQLIEADTMEDQDQDQEEEEDPTGTTSTLLDAVRTGNIHLLRHVTKSDRKRNQKDLGLALHEAVRRGQEECFHILVQGGASVQCLNEYGETLLLTALNSGRTAIVAALFKEGYEVDLSVGNSLDTGQIVPLQLAIMRNQPEMVGLLLEQGANTEYCDVDRDTPLITATNAESMDIVRLLIKHGANVNALGYEGNTAMHRAVELNNAALLTILLGAKPSVDVHNEQGNTALHLASEFGYLECVDVLMKAGAKPGSTNNASQNALHLSVMDGNVEIVMRLLQDPDLNINAVDSTGNTAAVIAAFLKHELACLVLVHKGADIRVQDETKRTVIHWAANHGLSELLKILVNHKDLQVDVEDTHGDTPILLAAQNTHYDCVALLLDVCADPAKQGTKGYNCLHWMAMKGCSENVFRALLEKVLDVNPKDEDNCTPIILAAKYRRYLLMQVLLEETQCDVNIQGKDGRTALHWVCSQGYYDIVWQLLRRDAAADITDAAMDTALHLASRGRHPEVVEELLNYGANANLRDSRGRLALHWACAENNIDVVNVLLCAPTELDTLDNDKDAALNLASRLHNEDIVRALVSSGADCNLFDAKGKTALSHMAEAGKLRTVSFLLECGACVNSERFLASPLIQACKKCHLDVVKLLLEHRANTEHQDELGRTAFLWAVAKGVEEIARCLVEQDTNSRHSDKSGDTALTLAAWHGHPILVSYLIPLSDIEHNENEEGMTALHLAICRDKRECVRVLLDAGADINQVSQTGNNALVLAAIHTSGPDVMAMVLNSGQEVDYNSKGEKARAALHWSVGDPESVAILLQKTPAGILDLDSEDVNGASPLLLAIAHGQPESARLLLEAGCDSKRLHQDGRRPIHHCALYGDCATMEILLDKGVSPDTPTEETRTALLIASIEGNVDIVKLLLKHNCGVNGVFKDAITPLSTAADRNYYEIMELLLDAGADPDAIGGERHSPLMTCTFQEDLRGMGILLKANADVNQCVDSGGNRLIHVAVLKNNTQALLLLLEAGLADNHVREVLSNGVLALLVQSGLGSTAMKQLTSSPRPLQQLCRLTIRNVLRYPLLRKLDKLDLPLMMKKYLAMSDIEKVYQTPL